MQAGRHAQPCRFAGLCNAADCAAGAAPAGPPLVAAVSSQREARWRLSGHSAGAIARSMFAPHAAVRPTATPTADAESTRQSAWAAVDSQAIAVAPVSHVLVRPDARHVLSAPPACGEYIWQHACAVATWVPGACMAAQACQRPTTPQRPQLRCSQPPRRSTHPRHKLR